MSDSENGIWTHDCVRAIGGQAFLMPERVKEPQVQFEFETGLLSFTCATEGASIYYTTDDATPDDSGASQLVVESEDAVLPNTDAHTTTVKCVAYKLGMVPSSVRVQLVVVKKVATPKLSPSISDSILANPWVALSCATDGAEIKYQVSEMTPSEAQTFLPLSADEVMTLYSGSPINVVPTLETSIVVTSVAFKNGFIASEVVKCAYHATSCKAPDISQLANGYITMACRTKDATIYFTLDGSEPTKDSTVYRNEDAVQVDTESIDEQVVKAFAVSEGLIDSSTAELEIAFNQVARPVIGQHNPTTDPGRVPGSVAAFAPLSNSSNLIVGTKKLALFRVINKQGDDNILDQSELEDALGNQEFLDFVGGLGIDLKQTADTADSARRVFKCLDKNDSGDVTMNEFLQGLERLGRGLISVQASTSEQLKRPTPQPAAAAARMSLPLETFEIVCAEDGAAITYTKQFVSSAFFADDEDMFDPFTDLDAVAYNSTFKLDRSEAGVRPTTQWNIVLPRFKIVPYISI